MGRRDLLLAQDMMASGDPALPLLRGALRRFHAEGDLSNVLVVLHNGAQALAMTGDTSRAQRLREAVEKHIARRGMRLGQTYAGGNAPDERRNPAVDPRDDVLPSLEETMDLFDAGAGA